MKYFILIFLLFLFPINEPLLSGNQLLRDSNTKEKKIREKLTIEDLNYPMLFNNNIYDFVTVAIYGTGAPGSGVIIAQKDNNYYVLTANHVIGELLKGDVIEVQTLDGEYHDAELLKSDNEIDGALIKFTSKNTYYSAFIHPEVMPKRGMFILTTGYALASKEATQGSLRRSTGPIITIINKNKDGYDLLYDAATNIGMSGGGIFSDFGQTKIKGKGWEKANKDCFGFSTPILIGIHGKAESYRAGGKSGASMGISVHTMLSKFGQILVNEGLTSLPSEKETLIYKDGCPIYNKVKNIF